MVSIRQNLELYSLRICVLFKNCAAAVIILLTYVEIH